MPELPEVETTRRGIEPYCRARRIESVTVRERRLRWPVPEGLEQSLTGQSITAVRRRAKYLLLETTAGSLMVHLGMSGSLRLVASGSPPGRHDHVDIGLLGGQVLRYNDPRRFGSMHWLLPGQSHVLLQGLGPEPLSEDFHGELLFTRSRGRRGAVKQFIMDGRIVVGVGNIYANEALFHAGIRPDRAAGRISLARYVRLAEEIKRVLTYAIGRGGTTLRDFVGGDGKPGYFAQELFVYGRGGEPCKCCGGKLREKPLNQRNTVYCIACQH